MDVHVLTICQIVVRVRVCVCKFSTTHKADNGSSCFSFVKIEWS